MLCQPRQPQFTRSYANTMWPSLHRSRRVLASSSPTSQHRLTNPNQQCIYLPLISVPTCAVNAQHRESYSVVASDSMEMKNGIRIVSVRPKRSDDYSPTL